MKYVFIESWCLLSKGASPVFPKALTSVKKIQEAGYGLLWIANKEEKKWPLVKAILAGEDMRGQETGKDLSDLLVFLKDKEIEFSQCYWIGWEETRKSDAQRLGSVYFDLQKTDWPEIAYEIVHPKERFAKIHRKTKETDIKIKLNLDGTGKRSIRTGIPFFDHMLEQLAKHGGLDLVIHAEGDLEIDKHHTVEDTAITLGKALKKAAGDKRGIGRYGFTLPMDEALAACALDFSGRSVVIYEAEIKREKVGDLPVELVKHFFESLCQHAGINLNLKITGKNAHHMIESGFKAFAKALALAIKREGNALPSTKDVLE